MVTIRGKELINSQTHFKVSINILRDDILGLGLVLTVDDVHVKFALRTKEERTKFGYVLATFLNCLQEHTEGIGGMGEVEVQQNTRKLDVVSK